MLLDCQLKFPSKSEATNKNSLKDSELTRCSN